MPSSTMRCAGVATRSAPSIVIAPRIGRIRPEITRIKVVLPAPLGPITATASPRADLERDAEQRLKAAIAGIDRSEFEHRGEPAQSRAAAACTASASVPR